MKLTILVGPAGSGKSTYSKQFPNLVRISQDDQGKQLHYRLFAQAVATGADIIVDRMNFSVMQREKYIKPAREAGYLVNIVEFRMSRYRCLDRCLKRIHNEGHPTIQNEHNASQAVNTFFKSYEKPTELEYDLYTVIEDDCDGMIKSKPKAIVCDLDGTLCNIDHRLQFVKGEGKKDWKAFFDGISGDSVNVWCKEILKAFDLKDYEIVLCSGRPDNYRASTSYWLHENEIPYDSLYMRERNDFRRDDIVKEILYLFEIKPYYDVLFVVDDRMQVVEKWRELGLICLQCHPGEF